MTALLQDDFLLKIAAIALPAGIFLSYLAIYKLKHFFWVLMLLIPLSVNLEDIGLGVGISLPGELLIALTAILVVMNFLTGRWIDQQLWNHPVAVMVFLNLIWMISTSLTSTMPVISLKFVLVRIMFVLTFFLLAAKIFQKPADFRKGLFFYLLPLLGVIGYALFRHSGFHFHQQASEMVVEPFFKDHTVYGATLALIFPLTLFSFWLPKSNRFKIPALLSIGLSSILLIGILFSYSRAAWISVFVIGLAGLLLWFQVRFRYILLGFAGLMALIWMNRQAVFTQMQANKVTRSPDFEEHFQSATNITTSVSNKERLNRWKSAIRMFRDKPFWGFGPGTYMFQYGPYQYKQDMTRISTYHADMGGAHSEYLKPLVESGIIGFFTFTGIVIAIGLTGMRVIYNAKSREIRITSMAVLASLTGYWAHGFVNYFSHTDKVAMLFWGLSAFLVVMDVQQQSHYQELKAVGGYKNPF